MIPQDFIHTLLDRTDIVEVIERYVPLKKAGANYQARCPFHSEKSPSFTVSPTKQFYHCFGCGAHGTAICFLMEHGGMSFVEAVRDLATRVGLPVPEEDRPARQDETGRLERLYERMVQTEQFYRGRLKASEQAVAYLKGRGLTGQTAARFALGYAPDAWQGLAGVFEDYDDKTLEEAGLIIAGEGGKRYDRFRDRVMFPIRNERGRVIAFGGRVIGPGEPKYLNSPETALFHKGRELYGLYEHRRDIQHAGSVLVVEGYMDVVMLAQHGVNNVVATLGTAVTSDQVRRLFRLVDDVVFAFDGDAAGRKAAWRALENTLPQLVDGKRAAFLFLPEGEDPDSYVRGQGADAFRVQVDRAMPLSEFLVGELTARTDLESQEGRVRLATLAGPYLRQLVQAPMLASALGQRLTEVTGVPLRPAMRERVPPGRTTRKPKSVGFSPCRVLVQAVLQRPERATLLDDSALPPHPECRLLQSLLAILREHPHVTNPRDVVGLFEGRPERDAIAEAQAEVELVWDKDYDMEADLEGALASLREQAGKQESTLLSQKGLADLTPEERDRLRESVKAKKLPPLAAVKSRDGR